MFMVAFISTQLLALVFVTIDMVIKIIRCCKAKSSKVVKEDPHTDAKPKRDTQEGNYWEQDRNSNGSGKRPYREDQSSELESKDQINS